MRSRFKCKSAICSTALGNCDALRHPDGDKTEGRLWRSKPGVQEILAPWGDEVGRERVKGNQEWVAGQKPRK